MSAENTDIEQRTEADMADITAIEDPSIGFFETARDLLQVESPEGCFVKTSESLTQKLGCSGTELRRTAFFDLVFPDDLPAVAADLTAFRQPPFHGFSHNARSVVNPSV